MGQASSRFLSRLEEIVQPSGVGTTMGDRALVVKAVLATSAVAIASTLVLIPVFFLLSEPVAGWLTVFSSFVYLSAVLLFVATGSVRSTYQLAIWVGISSVIAIQIVLGGYEWSGGFLLWGIANCVMAALWLDRLNTYLLMATFGVVAIVLAILDPTIQSLRSQPDPLIARLVLVDILIVTILLTTPLTLALLNRIRTEQDRARSLLLNVLPESIADRLQVSRGWIAEKYDECTVLFTDLVGFTAHTHESSPEQILAELNVVFSRFDDLVTRCGGEKIKTIGDGYMVAFGAPEPMAGHTVAACRLALDMVASLVEINRMIDSDFKIRIGISSGPLIGGVIGTKKFAYDLWGEDVNLASRLERAAAPGTILVSESVAGGAGDEFEFEPVGNLDLKGMPQVRAFMLVEDSRTDSPGVPAS